MKFNKDDSFMPKKQKQGIIFFIGIGLGVAIAIIVIIFSYFSNTGTAEFNESDILYSVNKDNSEGNNNKKYEERDYPSKTKRTYNPFPFNPNSITKTQLIEFGLSEKQASNIVNYVKAGGKFKETQDLKKLYCMTEDLYKAMSPYVRIPNQNNKDARKDNDNTSTSTNNIPKPFPTKPQIILDLNQSDSLDLQALRGIGPSFGKRIYVYGKKLGGYVEIVQLKEVYGMTDTLYNSIIQHLKIENTNPKKININSATIKELSSHPYIDFYLAKAIIKLRIELNNYKSLDQIRPIHILDQKSYEKLIPYLEL